MNIYLFCLGKIFTSRLDLRKVKVELEFGSPSLIKNINGKQMLSLIRSRFGFMGLGLDGERAQD